MTDARLSQFYGHSGGVMVSQPRPGIFEERPMTAGELAARDPAIKIASDIFRHANQAGGCYYEIHLTIASSIDAELAKALHPGVWRCYHCGEVFTGAQEAREHFGDTEASKAACLIKIAHGGERGLLTALRKAEQELARYVNDDSDAQRQLSALQYRHARALEAAEEAGYQRGLRDAQRNPA
jgi:ribosomal protein L37AE/L43A